jgi:hypothetical protein
LIERFGGIHEFLSASSTKTFQQRQSTKATFDGCNSILPFRIGILPIALGAP